MNKEIIKLFENEFEYTHTFCEVAETIVSRVNDILQQHGYDIEFEIEEITDE